MSVSNIPPKFTARFIICRKDNKTSPVSGEKL